MADTDLLDYAGLKHYDSKIKSCMWNWQKSKKNTLVQFKPVPESDLEPVVDFMFTETPPAEGEKGPDNPSTITGVSSVVAGRIGKNLLLKINGHSSWYGLSITSQQDGSILINGTYTSNQQRYFSLTDCGTLFSGPFSKVRLDTSRNYTLSVRSISGSITGDASVSCGMNDGSNHILFAYQNFTFSTGAFLTKTNSASVLPDGNFIVRLNISSGAIFDNYVIQVQLEEGDTATAFEAPMRPADANYTIQLGDTYYGGSLDVATGVMTVTWGGSYINSFSNADASATDVVNFYSNVDFTHKGNIYLTDGENFTCNRFGYSAASQTNVEGIRQSGSTSSGARGIYVKILKSRLDVSGAADPSNPTSEEWLAAGNVWLTSNPVFFASLLNAPQTVQLTPTQIRSLPAIDKYDPRVNTVYTDQEAVQVGYQRFYDENRLAAIEARLDALEGN